MSSSFFVHTLSHTHFVKEEKRQLCGTCGQYNTNMCLWEMEPTDISDNGHEEIERNWAFLINCIDDVGV